MAGTKTVFSGPGLSAVKYLCRDHDTGLGELPGLTANLLLAAFGGVMKTLTKLMLSALAGGVTSEARLSASEAGLSVKSEKTWLSEKPCERSSCKAACLGSSMPATTDCLSLVQ